MNIPVTAPIHLLHAQPVGVLATHARQSTGFPFPTVLSYALDAHHRPVVLVSRLAEHTRNLAADSRAGFLVYDPAVDVSNAERVTIVGRFEPTDEAGATLARRYLRYHPEAEQYLALGDFVFYVLRPQRIRYIGGFGAMGWLDAAQWDGLPALAEHEEQELIDALTPSDAAARGFRLLGVDRFGADWVQHGCRARVALNEPRNGLEALRAALAAELRQLG
ncbi:pyridoxamine 5'-phosphate oxidase family protein [Mycetohabitans endofungorum]|uniref:HugZ family pyridoxamine 5'-phosphate oxidase n=1 Tax=Mycetohabitans endofungorum TaxID=417203 RepID=UPI0030D3A0CA